MSRKALLPLAVFFLACDVASEPEPIVDEAAEAVRTAVVDRDDLLAAVTEGSARSMASPDASIHVLATPDFAPSYATIDPYYAGSNVEFPRGAMVVREIYDASGELTKITVIVRGEEGDNPGVGDLLFGVLTPEGEWMLDEAGEPQFGALETCGGCHAGRSNDGWLWGVPR